jgi:tRNA-2-methylthio-N6-dimethylallyladenosine synthase
MKFYIETFGCQMNAADSEVVAGILTRDGFEPAGDINDADVILFNTCTVRQHAEDRVMGRISQEAARKRTKPGLKIGVIGCVAQRLGESLLNKQIDFVVGVDQYQHLPRIIGMLDFWGVRASTEVNNEQTYDLYAPKRVEGLSAFITIMRGCNNFCSYCIVPYVRGRERSRPAPNLVGEVRQAGIDGYLDITLLGQNVNSYAWRDYDFPRLLQEAAQVDTIRRLRFITSHPKDLSDRLIEVMAAEERVCEHVHLPMQAGDDEILARMNRNYTAAHYRELVRKLRDAMPDIAITTDIMTGFPGESVEQFERTYQMVEEIGFDYAYTFKYSPREGSKAAEYPDQVPEEERLRRLAMLIDLQTSITERKYREKIGSRQEIFIEQISKKDALEVSGRTRDDKIAVFPGDRSLIGTFVNIRVTEASGWTLRGVIEP